MPASITIIAEDNGQVRVEGAIENSVVAYGLLEVARDCIQRFHAERAASSIRPPTQSDILALRRTQ